MQAIKKGAFPPKRKDAVVLPQYCTGNRGACQAGAVRGPLPVTGRGACPRRGPWPGGPRKSVRARTGRENPYPFASLTHRGFRGWLSQPGRSEQLKIPERPLWRGFIAQRGHALRNALCGGVLSPRGGSHPALASPAGRQALYKPTPCPLPCTYYAKEDSLPAWEGEINL